MSAQAQLTTRTVEGVIVATLSGEIDTSNVGPLQSGLSAVVSERPGPLVVDLAGTTYLDSAGVRLLFDLARTQRSHGQGMRIVAPKPSPLRRVLSITGIDTVVPVDERTEDAIDGLSTDPTG